MSTRYTAEVVLPFTTPLGRELETKRVELTLVDPPHPAAELIISAVVLGRHVRVPVRIPTVVSGQALADGAHVHLECDPIVLPPVETSLSTVTTIGAPDKPPVQVIHEKYNG
jgi:hypothetical protein